jgi:polyhydroxyalkanoate synthesis regulator phasin
MIDYQKITRELKTKNLDEGKEPSLKSYIQSVSEALSNIKLSSKSDQRRIELAQQHMREVRKHARRLEERVSVLEEQVSMLEEEKVRIKKLNEAQYTMFTISGETPEDIAGYIKDKIDISTLNVDNYQSVVGEYLLASGVLDDEWQEWEEAVWLELTKSGGEV